MPLVAFVVNRTLLRDPEGFFSRCQAAAKEHGWEPEFAPTSETDGALVLARRAVDAGAGLVFAAGGDGTVRACAEALAGTRVPLGIVPLGTANLTARALGIPGRAGPAIDAGFGGWDRRIDLALVHGAGQDRGGDADGTGTPDGDADGTGTPGGTVFAAMAGIGLDAAVVEAARRDVKRRLGWVAYAVSGLTRLWWPATDFTVRLDGAEPIHRRARCVVVGNSGLLPGGFGLLPRARLDDGQLDVGILAPSGPLGWLRVAGHILTRSRTGNGHLERFQASRVEISAATALPRQIDGELADPGHTLDVSVWPHALTVRQPARHAGNGRA
ncbi:MAG: diacylglycerol kinase family protein [Streptosporangiaceae bacterium]